MISWKKNPWICSTSVRESLISHSEFYHSYLLRTSWNTWFLAGPDKNNYGQHVEMQRKPLLAKIAMPDFCFLQQHSKHHSPDGWDSPVFTLASIWESQTSFRGCGGISKAGFSWSILDVHFWKKAGTKPTCSTRKLRLEIQI